MKCDSISTTCHGYTLTCTLALGPKCTDVEGSFSQLSRRGSPRQGEVTCVGLHSWTQEIQSLLPEHTGLVTIQGSEH